MKTGFLPASPAALQRALWEKDSDWLMVGLCCGDGAQFINSEQRNGVIPFTTRIIKAIHADQARGCVGKGCAGGEQQGKGA